LPAGSAHAVHWLGPERRPISRIGEASLHG
jgi:hypothetical protein